MAALAPPALASASVAAAAIRSLRAQSNAGLASRDAASVTAMFTDDIHSIAGSGALSSGRSAVSQAYADDLAPGGAFLRGQRVPGRIAVRRDGTQAAEPGRWEWAVRTAMGEAAYSGDYLAGWRRESEGWRLQSELYVTTGCRGPGCPS